METIKICSTCAATMNGKICSKCGCQFYHIITEQKTISSNLSEFKTGFNKVSEEVKTSQLPLIPMFGRRKL